MGSTEPSIDVAEDSGGLHMKGVDVCDGFHLEAILQQKLLNLICFSQNGN